MVVERQPAIRLPQGTGLSIVKLSFQQRAAMNKTWKAWQSYFLGVATCRQIQTKHSKINTIRRGNRSSSRQTTILL
jgi:hypothetical protein